MIPESTEEEETKVELTDVRLPGVVALFSQGWQYTRNNLVLVGILSLPFLLLDVLRYLGEISTGSLSSSGVLGLVSFLALLVYVLLLATALYLVTHQAQTPLFSDGFTWAKRHVWSVVWVSILTWFVVWGGFLLLVVPGIIAATYIALSQIVLATEGGKGMSALMRSRELVYGNWLAVFGRMLGVQLLYFGIVVGIGIIVGIGPTYFTNELFSEFILNLLFTVLGSAGTLIWLSVTYQLYTGLKTAKESTPPVLVHSAATGYQALAWFGLVAIFFLMGVVVVAMQSIDSANVENNRVTDTVLATELKLVQLQADRYYANQPEPSFAGVCSEVQGLVSGDKVVACSESKDAYALSVQQGGTLRCVDSTGYDKIIYTDLDERTQCLDV